MRDTNMDYISAQEAADKWGVSARWVQSYAMKGRIDGVIRFGRSWMIPKDTEKPKDARITTGEWIGYWRKDKNIEGDES